MVFDCKSKTASILSEWTGVIMLVTFALFLEHQPLNAFMSMDTIHAATLEEESLDECF